MTTTPAEDAASTTGPAVPEARRPPARLGRSSVELLTDQLFGIDEWHRLYGSKATARALARQTARTTAARSRETRADLTRRAEDRRAEHQALLDRARAALDSSVEMLAARPPLRAVLAHRDVEFVGRVTERLRERGVDVLLVTPDGAQAAGAVVVEQPEILLVEDRLSTLNGLQVLERAAHCCPRTLTAAQVLDAAQLDLFREGGARALFTRRVPPREVADTVLDCLLRDADASVL